MLSPKEESEWFGAEYEVSIERNMIQHLDGVEIEADSQRELKDKAKEIGYERSDDFVNTKVVGGLDGYSIAHQDLVKGAESSELSHNEKATMIYDDIQQNLNNPEAVKVYYELFYGEKPPENYEGDMALDVIEAVQQNLNGKAFVNYMYNEMFGAESFDVEMPKSVKMGFGFGAGLALFQVAVIAGAVTLGMITSKR